MQSRPADEEPMAKKASSETNLPLIIALIFFALSTIGLGVFVYVLMDEKAAKDKAVADAKAERAAALKSEADAQMVARLLRVYFGVGSRPPEVKPAAPGEAAPPPPAADNSDVSVVLKQVKEGTEAFKELDRLNKETRSRVPPTTNPEDVAKFKEAVLAKYREAKAKGEDEKFIENMISIPDDLVFWKPEFDSRTKELVRPTTDMLDLVVRAKIVRDMALRMGDAERASYQTTLKAMDEAAKQYKAAHDAFVDKAKEIPEKINTAMKKMQDELTGKLEAYDKSMASANTRVREAQNKFNDVEREKRKVDVALADARNEVVILNQKLADAQGRNAGGSSVFKFEEPQGKITRRNADGTVEIDLGDNARVREGLTFTVLPLDYPEKGQQSRMKMVRVPDGKGGYRSEVQFTPKGTIEVIRTLGPNASLARLSGEADKISDRVMPGDLLYSAVWKRGQAERIALIGIFDTNGDGVDDIQTIIRDLKKMGVEVDAYYNPNKKNAEGKPVGGWEGTVGDRVRYVVKGSFPEPSGTDPTNAGAMGLLNAKYTEAFKAIQNRGATTVGMREFFPRMGYRIRMDVSGDAIRQAARRYIDLVPGGGP